jgi:pimeloyl-ACP methyl ester carboxylesterase
MLVELPDKRVLEATVAGPAGAPVLLTHHGTPGGRVLYPPLVEAATRHGLRTVAYARPGYGASTPHPGRSIADAAADSAALLDRLGVDTFLTLGWSGGGPHALACATLLAGRCRAAASVAGVAPYDATGLVWLDGMGQGNVDEFGVAVAGEAPLTEFLTKAAEQLVDARAASAAGVERESPDVMDDLLSDVDRERIAAGFDRYLAESFEAALANGIAGWRDDDLAFVRPWGFRPGTPVPVAIWQGDQDLMVPLAHGRWLTRALPDASPHLLPGAGHISVITDSIDDIIDELLSHQDRA